MPHRLHYSYHQESPEELESWINYFDKEDIDHVDEYGNTLLHKACYNGQPNLVEKLLGKGADLFLKGENGLDAFSMLSLSKNQTASVKIFQQLIGQSKYLSKFQEKTKEEMQDLILLALENNNEELTKLLFEHTKPEYRIEIQTSIFKKIIDAKDSDKLGQWLELNLTANYDSLKGTLLSGDHEKVRILLAHDSNFAQLNIQNDDGNLLNTVYKYQKYLQSKIVELKTKPISADDQKSIDAYQKNIDGLYKSMSEILTKNSFDLTSALAKTDPNILTDAFVAWKKSDNNNGKEHELFQKILAHKQTEGYLATPAGKDLMLLAVEYGDYDTYTKVKECYGEPQGNDLIDELVYKAAKSGSWEVTRELLNKIVASEYVDPEYDDFGGYLVDKARGSDTKDSFKESLSKRYSQGEDLLMAACEGSDVEIVTILKECISVKNVDFNGDTALHYLAKSPKPKDNEAILSVLLEAGADINAKNKDGYTPLMMAVFSNNADLIRKLLDKGADINAYDKQGNTALIYACSLNKAESIDAVLSANDLDVTHKNKAGVSGYAISARRDICESKAADRTVEEQAGKQVKSSGSEKADAKNSYPNLTKHLLSRGADPYEYSTTGILDVAIVSTVAVGAAKVGGAVAAITKDSPFSIAGNAVKWITSIGAGLAIGSSIKDWIYSIVKTATTLSEDQVNIQDSIMIGVVHDKGPFIKRGLSLQKNIEKHYQFQDKKAIYSVGDLESRITELDKPGAEEKERFRSFALEAQKDLQDQYVALERRIQNLPWYYSWKKGVLESAKEDIIGAYKRLKNNVTLKNMFEISVEVDKVNKVSTQKDFETECKNLVDILKVEQDSRCLLRAIIEPPERMDENMKHIETIVDMVCKKEILVSPETYALFLKFSQEKKLILQSTSSKDTFCLVSEQFPADRHGELKVEIDNVSKIKSDIPQVKSKKVEEDSLKRQGIEAGKRVLRAGISKAVSVVSSGGTEAENVEAGLQFAANVGGVAVGAAATVAMSDNPEEVMVANAKLRLVEKTANLAYGAAKDLGWAGLWGWKQAYSLAPTVTLVVTGIGVVAAGVYAGYLPSADTATSYVQPIVDRVKGVSTMFSSSPKKISVNIAPSEIVDLPAKLSPERAAGKVLSDLGVTSGGSKKAARGSGGLGNSVRQHS